MISLHFFALYRVKQRHQIMSSTSTRVSEDVESDHVNEQEAEGDRLVTYYTVLQIKESARAEEGAWFNMNGANAISPQGVSAISFTMSP
jgi:hypothetical protein